MHKQGASDSLFNTKVCPIQKISERLGHRDTEDGVRELHAHQSKEMIIPKITAPQDITQA